ncbi:hypothetical protein AAMO2058_000110500 [Amorphochlora amoebiformis]
MSVAEDDEDYYGEESTGILLGFVEDKNDISYPLTAPYFPSKVGGKPAWLNLSEIPFVGSCRECKKALSFLLQVYAPREEWQGGGEHTFHRTIYVFTCRTSTCLKSSGSVRVFRSQLPRKNEFYPFDPSPPPSSPVCEKINQEFSPLGGDIMLAAKHGVNLCVVCGLRSTQRCGRCKQTFYCNRDHQVAHWRAEHKERCLGQAAPKPRDPGNKSISKSAGRRDRKKRKAAWEAMKSLVFPEFELIIEEELQTDVENAKAKAFSKEEKLLKEYETIQAKMSAKDREAEKKAFQSDKGLLRAFEGTDAEAVRSAIKAKASKPHNLKTLKSHNLKTSKSHNLESSPEIAFEDGDDEPESPGTIQDKLAFERFQALVSANPDQVLRYASNEEGKEGKNKSAMSPGPLWISTKGQAQAESVPVCKGCGKKRQFEFQIMPQLLNYLNVDPAQKNSLDWGVLAVYSCPKSCGDGNKGYFEEHIHCQMLTK